MRLKDTIALVHLFWEGGSCRNKEQRLQTRRETLNLQMTSWPLEISPTRAPWPARGSAPQPRFTVLYK